MFRSLTLCSHLALASLALTKATLTPLAKVRSPYTVSSFLSAETLHSCHSGILVYAGMNGLESPPELSLGCDHHDSHPYPKLLPISIKSVHQPEIIL
mmetsp:Transcript_35088/g.74042  ORF Transcript_35088/g.74042 Transcript_35088/m.74042 type:complete len:97 (+) Transcript_35088:1877-2167(+)